MNKKTEVTNQKYQLSASIICADMLHLRRDISQLDKAQIDFIHFDVMDGSFVPRLGLHPEILIQIKSQTKIPIDVHLMINSPENYLETFAQAGADIITVHAESTPHLHRIVNLIHHFGKKVGVAINPATPLSVLDYILDDIELVLIMGINPGIVGHKLIPSTLKKITDLKNRVNMKSLIIEVDGGVTPQSAPLMIKAGANMLVCGTSTIFQSPKPIPRLTRKLRLAIKNA